MTCDGIPNLQLGLHCSEKTVEGRPRTLSRPSPDPAVTMSLHLASLAVVDQVVTVMPGCGVSPGGFHRRDGVRGAGAPLLTRVIDANRLVGPSPAAW